jgi:hypothetical protein
MNFYSFVVHAPGEVDLPEQHLILERGMNAFNALVDLDSFKELLASNGVRITQVNRLDEHEPVPEDSTALPHVHQNPLLRSGS